LGIPIPLTFISHIGEEKMNNGLVKKTERTSQITNGKSQFAIGILVLLVFLGAGCSSVTGPAAISGQLKKGTR